MLRPLSLVVGHGRRLMPSPIGLPSFPGDGATRAHQGQRRSRG
jgi:hypothetical protein